MLALHYADRDKIDAAITEPPQERDALGPTRRPRTTHSATRDDPLGDLGRPTRRRGTTHCGISGPLAGQGAAMGLMGPGISSGSMWMVTTRSSTASSRRPSTASARSWPSCTDHRPGTSMHLDEAQVTALACAHHGTRRRRIGIRQAHRRSPQPPRRVAPHPSAPTSTRRPAGTDEQDAMATAMAMTGSSRSHPVTATTMIPDDADGGHQIRQQMFPVGGQRDRPVLPPGPDQNQRHGPVKALRYHRDQYADAERFQRPRMEQPLDRRDQDHRRGDEDHRPSTPAEKYSALACPKLWFVVGGPRRDAQCDESDDRRNEVDDRLGRV